MPRPRAADEYVRLITSALVSPLKVKEVFAKLGRGPVADHLAGLVEQLEHLAQRYECVPALWLEAVLTWG